MRQSTFLRKALRALRASGWKVSGVDDGGDTVERVTTLRDVMTAVRATDESHVILRHDDGRKAWLRIIWQGPDATYAYGEEIISDYTISLTDVIDPLYRGHANA